MSIRAARFADHWRHALVRAYPVRYESLRYSGLRSLHDDSVEFANGITAIVGGNGVGKSTLAHAAIDALSDKGAVRALSGRSVRLSGGEFCASVSKSSSTTDVHLSIGSDGARSKSGVVNANVIWVDSAEMASVCQRQILGDSEFQELLESHGSRSLNQDELELASYVVGKDYSVCELWEISDYADLDTFPYFRVTVDEVTYGSEDMGSGELSMLICLWFLQRIEKNSIVVIEEPETHVSSRSQAALMNLIAWACHVKGLWIILTTHSPVILRRIPLENVRLLINEHGKSRLISSPTWHQIGIILGGGVSHRGVVLVEDECSMHFLCAILDRLQTNLRYQLQIVVASGGASRIAQALTKLPKIQAWPMIGVFDGDQRSLTDSSKFEWPHVFLPSNVSPEKLLRNSLLDMLAVDRLAIALRQRRDSVVLAKNAAAGLDDHDWLFKFCTALKISIETGVKAIAGVWMDDNLAEAKEFLESMVSALDEFVRNNS